MRLIEEREVMDGTRVADAHKCFIPKEIGVDGGDEIVAFEGGGDRVERLLGPDGAM
jgi:hypothetical protein